MSNEQLISEAGDTYPPTDEDGNPIINEDPRDTLDEYNQPSYE